MINFTNSQCQTSSSNRKFGLCDDPAPAQNPAYIDESDGSRWIAVVENEFSYDVTFTAIDNCIDITEANGQMAQRCEGMVTYNSTVIFVELKDRKGSDWIRDADDQLRSTISYFENNPLSTSYEIKKAFIANKRSPKFRVSQMTRMEKFYSETGYVLRIDARIILD